NRAVFRGPAATSNLGVISNPVGLRRRPVVTSRRRTSRPPDAPAAQVPVAGVGPVAPVAASALP
nr:hypothetical protein [Micromonospora sp. DSM 115978]